MLTIHADNLERLMNCNGSLKMAGNLAPAISGGEEGIAAQFAALAIASGQATPETLLDKPAPNGVFITDTMLDYVLVFTNAIKQPSLQYEGFNLDVSFGNGNWKIEAISHHIAMSGTTLFVDRLFYGWGIVEPDYHYGLIAEAIGYCLISGATPETIVLTVHQPRPSHPLGPCREVTIDFRALMGKFKASIFDVMAKPSDNVRSGLQWCRKCRALDKCPAARGAAMNAIDHIALATNEDLTGEDLANELIALERAQGAIKERLNALTERATYQVRNGEVVPNFSLEKSYSNRKWKEFVTPETLSMLTGQNKVTTEKLLSPPQLQARGVPETVINSLSERVETKPKLTRVDANKLAKHKLKGK